MVESFKVNNQHRFIRSAFRHPPLQRGKNQSGVECRGWFVVKLTQPSLTMDVKMDDCHCSGRWI